MTHKIKQLYKWMGSRVDTPYAELILATTFYLESCILFLPTDPMLIIYCVKNRSKSLRYAAIATISSVLGGITGYIIGLTVWQSIGQEIIHSKIINYIMTPKQFTYSCDLYHRYEFWAVFIAGFTPIPYKAATLTAGFCQLSFMPFVLSSIVSRGARYYLYAIIIKVYGKQIKQSLSRYFNLVIMLVFFIIALVYYFIK